MINTGLSPDQANTADNLYADHLNASVELAAAHRTLHDAIDAEIIRASFVNTETDITRPSSVNTGVGGVNRARANYDHNVQASRQHYLDNEEAYRSQAKLEAINNGVTINDSPEGNRQANEIDERFGKLAVEEALRILNKADEANEDLRIAA